jgi:tRNA (guanine37-N1)-methyltransferase
MTKPVWQAHVATLFPAFFPGPLGLSVIGRALTQGTWSLNAHNMRSGSDRADGRVDDTPYGGGAGMVIRPDVLDRVLTSMPNDCPMVYLSPRGKPLTQDMVKSYASGKGISLICGRYEGIDERILDKYPINEVSIGDYILSGGEVAACALLEACVRLLPGVMGSAESEIEESFENNLLEYPQYTRPACWEGRSVPDVLISGHHQNIKSWRLDQSEQLTKNRRPDLWRAYIRDEGNKT